MDSSTFQVVFTLRENDDESRGVGAILAAICHRSSSPRGGLNGSGGYLYGHPEVDNVAVLCFQKNRGDALLDITEEDRLLARDVLAKHPNVSRFLVGPIDPPKRSFHKMDKDEDSLVRRFRADRSPN